MIELALSLSVLLGGGGCVYDRPTVMHEILHDLLDGDGGHADPAWSACELPLGIG